MTDFQPAETLTSGSVPPERLTLLRQMLVTRFSVDELKTLCVDLDLEYDGMPGEGKEGKARELVAWFERRNRLPELEAKSKQLRPDIAWESERSEEKLPVISPPIFQKPPPVPHETINQHQIAALFHDLMQPASRFRVLRLIGDGKSGKSHFMTKVFPAMAHDAGLPCVVITLRYQAQNAADILHAICSYLGGLEAFPAYHAAYEQAQNRARAQMSGVQAWFSRISQTVESGAEDPRKMGRDLVPPFVADLRQRTGLTLLLFDAVNDATDMMRTWLTDTLVGQVSALGHLRIVVAGRSVPEPCGSYTAVCQSYVLPPVEEEEAYIAFCRRTDIDLREQSIRDFARACKYRPGAFADLVVPNFSRREATHA